MEPRIRPATMGDLFWLRLLMGQFTREASDFYPTIEETDLESLTAVFAARLANDPNFLCYVAEHEEAIVGFILGEIQTRIGTPSCFIFITYDFVAKGWRGKGIGRALAAALYHTAKERGATAAEFLARPNDPQWAARGWPVTTVLHSLPMNVVLASLAPRREVEERGHVNGG